MISSWFIAAQVWAAVLCPDSGSRVLAQKHFGLGVELVICGRQTPPAGIDDLSIYAIHPEGSESMRQRVFDGDTKLKTYTYHEMATGFAIDEALRPLTSNKAALDKRMWPFLRTQVTCEKGQCQAQATKCLWKKNRKILGASGWLEQFNLALNGNGKAKKLLKGEGVDAEARHSEEFSTFQADVLRLEKLGCL